MCDDSRKYDTLGFEVSVSLKKAKAVPMMKSTVTNAFRLLEIRIRKALFAKTGGRSNQDIDEPLFVLGLERCTAIFVFQMEKQARKNVINCHVVAWPGFKERYTVNSLWKILVYQRLTGEQYLWDKGFPIRTRFLKGVIRVRSEVQQREKAGRMLSRNPMRTGHEKSLQV